MPVAASTARTRSGGIRFQPDTAGCDTPIARASAEIPPLARIACSKPLSRINRPKPDSPPRPKAAPKSSITRNLLSRKCYHVIGAGYRPAAADYQILPFAKFGCDATRMRRGNHVVCSASDVKPAPPCRHDAADRTSPAALLPAALAFPEPAPRLAPAPHL